MTQRRAREVDTGETVKASTPRGDRKQTATGPTLHPRWVSVALGNTELSGCCILPSKESALSYSLVRGAPLHSATLSARPSFSACSTSPAPLDIALFLVSGVRRPRFCHTKGQPSSVAVVPLAALPPLYPCLLCEQLWWSKKTVFLGMPPARLQAYASCILLRLRLLHARLAKLLCELGCSRSTSAASHEIARLSQEVTLGALLTPQRRCRVPHAFCPSQFFLRCTIACVLARIGAARFHRSSFSSHP